MSKDQTKSLEREKKKETARSSLTIAFPLLFLLFFSWISGCSHHSVKTSADASKTPSQKDRQQLILQKKIEKQRKKELGYTKMISQELKKFFQETPASALLKAQQLKKDPFFLTWKDVLADFYKARDYRPLWWNPEQITDKRTSLELAENYLFKLGQAEENALQAHNYQYENLITWKKRWLKESAQGRQKEAMASLQQLEILLSSSFLHYAHDLTLGRVDPATIDELWNSPSRLYSPLPLLQRLQAGDSLQNLIDNHFPIHPAAERLKQTLIEYRRLRPLADALILPAGKFPLKEGQTDPRVAIMRQKLQLLGDLKKKIPKSDSDTVITMGPENQSDHFDERLTRALKRFQKRHQLEDTGKLDEKTQTMLNESLQNRIQTIEVNLERWRWLPQDFGERYIVVNIANYNLSAFASKKQVLTMKVIVGKPFRMTPVFSSMINSMTLHPIWTIPQSIYQKNILPDIQKNPQYIEENQIKVYEIVHENGGTQLIERDPATINWAEITGSRKGPGPHFVLKQSAGPKNPLGKIIFHLPNKYDIYLHDTSTPQSFAQDQRSLSSGCIRLERALDLADFIARETGSQWGGKVLQAILKKNESKRIALPRPIPVHLIYVTAWVTRKGVLHFRKDIYGRDALLAKKLSSR